MRIEPDDTIARVLAKLGLTGSAVFVTRQGHEGQEVITGLANVPDRPRFSALSCVRRGT